MWSPDRRHILAVLAAIPLMGCGFTPLYSTGADSMIGQVNIATIPGRSGFLMRERLIRRLGAPVEAPRFFLSIDVQTTSEGLAITQVGDITRYTLDGEAAFTLGEGRESLLQETVRSSAGYSATASVYAAQVAEEDAERRLAEDLAEKIANRVLVFMADLTR